jgi:hypothetical protein
MRGSYGPPLLGLVLCLFCLFAAFLLNSYFSRSVAREWADATGKFVGSVPNPWVLGGSGKRQFADGLPIRHRQSLRPCCGHPSDKP